MRYKTGSVYRAEAGDPGTYWRFQVMAVVAYEGKRYAVCLKLFDGPPSSMQTAVFDEAGCECDSPVMDFSLSHTIYPKKKWKIVA